MRQIITHIHGRFGNRGIYIQFSLLTMMLLLKALSVKPQLYDVIGSIPLSLIAYPIYESGSRLN